MNKLTKTAQTLDKVFKILQTVCSALMIAAAVFLVLIPVAYLLKLDPAMIGTGYASLDIGILELQVADGFAPDKWSVLLYAWVILATACICVFIGRKGIGCIRAILKPMTEGQPFDGAVSINLKKLSVLSIVFFVAYGIGGLVDEMMVVFLFDLPSLLISEKITHIAVNYQFDLSFLLISGILLLLSYVFRYGEELQQLSDETL